MKFPLRKRKKEKVQKSEAKQSDPAPIDSSEQEIPAKKTKKEKVEKSEAKQSDPAPIDSSEQEILAKKAKKEKVKKHEAKQSDLEPIDSSEQEIPAKKAKNADKPPREKPKNRMTYQEIRAARKAEKAAEHAKHALKMQFSTRRWKEAEVAHFGLEDARRRTGTDRLKMDGQYVIYAVTKKDLLLKLILSVHLPGLVSVKGLMTYAFLQFETDEIAKQQIARGGIDMYGSTVIVKEVMFPSPNANAMLHARQLLAFSHYLRPCLGEGFMCATGAVPSGLKLQYKSEEEGRKMLAQDSITVEGIKIEFFEWTDFHEALFDGKRRRLKPFEQFRQAAATKKKAEEYEKIKNIETITM